MWYTFWHNAYIYRHSSWKKHVHLSKYSSLTFLLLSIPYNYTSWQANFWNSTLSCLTQDWFSGLLTLLSLVLRQFLTKLYFTYSRLPTLFPPALHKALSYLLFCAFMLLYVHGGEMAYFGRGQSGKGTTEWTLDRGNRPKKTGEIVDRRQNNGSIKAVSPRHCPATCAEIEMTLYRNDRTKYKRKWESTKENLYSREGVQTTMY